MHFQNNALYFTVLTLSTSSAVFAAVQPWGQCGGQGYTGDKTCASGWTCKASNQYYSQCLQGAAAGAPPAAPTTLATAVVTTTKAAVKTSASSVVAKPSSAAAANPSAIAGSGANGAKCSINEAFKAHPNKLYIGTIADQGTLSNKANTQVIIDNFGQLTPENSMKWDATEPQQGKFNFAGADALVKFATDNKKLIRGHTTVWHSQLPTWVSSITDKTKLADVMKNHITKLMTQYKGKVYAWDVVNEILAEDGGFRSSVFHNVLGDDFVRIAFEAARKADPNAKLYINDYNLDDPNYAKTKGMVTKVKAWVAAGVPIDGIGSQSHLGSVWPAAKNAAALKTLCAVVDECAMTELDIAGAAASEYTTAIKGCLDVENCVGVTVWGVSDKDSWRQGENPLLFDGGFKAKAAYNAVCGIL
jgi:endo-1,4-beta-xylanase